MTNPANLTAAASRVGPNRISVVVLDMAGTTLRDDGLVERAFADALRATDVDPDTPAGAEAAGIARTTMGQSKIEVFRLIHPGQEARVAAALTAFEASVSAQLDQGALRPLPGAREAIDRMRDRGLRVGLTTGFSAETAAQVVEAIGWRDVVDSVLTPAPGRRGRPHPDLVLATLLALEGGAVWEVAVAGDTVNDLISGTRAGAGVVAGVLTGAHDRAELSSVPHTHLLASVTDLPAVVEGWLGGTP